MITTENARKILGHTGLTLNDDEIVKLKNRLYSLISQIVDNSLEQKECKRQ